jgi:hypothetical protein
MQEEENKKKTAADAEKISRLDEASRLIHQANQLQPDLGSDRSLDKENEKRFILEYKANNPKQRHIAFSIRPYLKQFRFAYYDNIYRLNKWDRSGRKIYKRPGIVGKWTIKLIYLRFPLGTIETLQTLNPMTEDGERLHKHFQFLTEVGEQNLRNFIDDAVAIMEQCSYWGQFVRVFSKKYGPEYQTHLFDVDPDL